ncbi:M28 family peptidase [Rahnella woolbedingensis]|uniref:Carboxypeptidase Q n=1 Tax=Rahnella woolbedingensis TaxID=1510574 RepID=A0A419N5N4_9GAMM|nr:M28 family peptidase [Rahnella woolbedingensis]RJT41529.1 M28 family peptidase [Rahnella woolbedingensis]
MLLRPPVREHLLPLMDGLLREFSTLHRLSGCEGAEQAARRMVSLLQEQGLDARLMHCPLYLSDPLAGRLRLPEQPQWQCDAKTRSFSAHCPQGVEGRAYYDAVACEPRTDLEWRSWAQDVRGKIVIAGQGFEDYVQRLCAAGAAGLIHIWGSAETALHEETVGPVWGTPEPDDFLRYPRLPVICVNQQDGQRLLAQLQREPLLVLEIATELNFHVAECSMPVVDIPGTTPEFVLLSSHYDAWHEGVTDNATGNALCLAMAIHFHQQPQTLLRGLRIIWWSGHSNARYGGSTWYADNYRQQLKQHCVAHINVDSPGCLDAVDVVLNASGAESHVFLNAAVEAVTGEPARRITTLGKGGDQSFWGCGLPLHFAFREVPLEKTSQSPGSGGGWWWHTEADTYDKVDLNILWRDTQIHAHWLESLLTQPALPLAPLAYLNGLQQSLAELISAISPEFDLRLVAEKLQQLQPVLAELTAKWQKDPMTWQPQLKQAIAGLHRLRYSSVDDFHYDLSYRGGAFPGFQELAAQRGETSPEMWLMMTTRFCRQRDRALSLLENVAAICRS